LPSQLSRAPRIRDAGALASPRLRRPKAIGALELETKKASSQKLSEDA
jgi:hypothetical protein